MNLSTQESLRKGMMLVATLDRLNRPDFEPSEVAIPTDYEDLRKAMWTTAQATIRLLHYQRRLEKALWVLGQTELPFSDLESVRQASDS